MAANELKLLGIKGLEKFIMLPQKGVYQRYIEPCQICKAENSYENSHQLLSINHFGKKLYERGSARS